MTNKPTKKSDKELWELVAETISNLNYIFLNHAKKRLEDRNITDIEVIDILENKNNRKRKRNKMKDSYSNGNKDWNYCIEGLDLEYKQIRVIISFSDENMLIITVIRLDNLE